MSIELLYTAVSPLQSLLAHTNILNAMSVIFCAGYIKMVQLLMVHHAEVDYTDTEGNSALHVACQDDVLDIAKLLIEHGADIHKKNKEEKTPLDYLKSGNRVMLTNIHQRNVIPR